jgi:tape measure domain-containing protein
MFQIKYVYDLVDKISPKLKTIQTNLKATADKVTDNGAVMAKGFDKMVSSLNKTGNSLKSASFNLAPISVAMGGLGIKALSSSANMETLAIQLEILTGSAEKGKKLFSDLNQYAAATPFQLPEIVKSTRTLLGSNIALEKATSTIEMLGDVSAGSGGDLQSLAVVFGQVAGMTRLQGQDAMQFISNGIPIWALLEKSTGKTVKTLRDMGSKGQISFKMVEDALTKATLAGGMYYQATEKLSTSLSGLYSTLKDQVNLAFAELGNEMVKAVDIKKLIKDLGEFAGKLTSYFKSLSPETKKFITYAVILGGVLAPVLATIGFMSIGIAALATSFSFLNRIILANPIIAFIAAMVLLYNTWDDFRIVVDWVAESIVGIFTTEWTAPFINALKDAWEWLDKILEKTKPLSNFFSNAKLIISTGADAINTKLDEKAGIVRDSFSANINQQQQLIAGGQMDINIKGLPKGSNSNFTPAPKSFMNIGVNSVYAGG